MFRKNAFAIATQTLTTFPNIGHLPNTGITQSASNDVFAYRGIGKLGGYAMLANVIKSPRCLKCGDTMALRVIEPERPGFDSRTFECPKCYDTETLVVSISHEADASAASV